MLIVLFYCIGYVLAFGLITGEIVKDYLSVVYIDYPEESHPIYNPRIVFYSFGSWFIVIGLLLSYRKDSNKKLLLRFSYKDIYKQKK